MIDGNIYTAYSIIEEAFKGKTDLGGFPYVEHLERVSQNFHDDLKIVALLHDLLEDTDWTEQKLSYYFRKTIVDKVVILTRVQGQSYEDYIQRVSKNQDAIKVKIADIEDNMDLTRIPYQLSDRDIERFKKYHKTWLQLVALQKF